MSITLRISVLLVALAIFLIIFQLLRRGRIPIKFSLLWQIAVLLLVLVAIFPQILEIIRKMIGFQTISNMVMGVMIVILILITIALTVIVSGQTTKIVILIQEISMLKNEIKEMRSKNENTDNNNSHI